jgi:hypothetical protein
MGNQALVLKPLLCKTCQGFFGANQKQEMLDCLPQKGSLEGDEIWAGFDTSGYPICIQVLRRRWQRV